MKAGFMWLDDAENMAMQTRARALLEKFNTLPPEANRERMEMNAEMFGSCGKNVWIVPPMKFTIGKHISIGEGCYFNQGITMIDDWKIEIGDRCLFGPNVTICTTGHAISPKHRGDGMYSFPIRIGNNCWIGANVVILPDVTFGDNTVIGAGSIVTKDIPANVIAFGSPCRVYREINERDDEYYFKDHRFDEQPLREDEKPALDFMDE